MPFLRQVQVVDAIVGHLPNKPLNSKTAPGVRLVNHPQLEVLHALVAYLQHGAAYKLRPVVSGDYHSDLNHLSPHDGLAPLHIAQGTCEQRSSNHTVARWS